MVNENSNMNHKSMRTQDSRLASNTLYLMNPGTSCSVHNCKTTEENQCVTVSVGCN